MASALASTNENLAKFQDLLRELFQFDCADLDFGIYRIMNHKRDVIERFISEQLPAKVSAALDSGPLAQQAQAEANLGALADRIRSNIGAEAIGPNGQLDLKFHAFPIGEEYLEAQAAAADSSRSRDAVEAAIYNHLYTFFCRYYEDGDFISKRRYSRNQRYAIPYNGEEVYLHWANSDQYYVKSDEHFRNYDWTAPNGVKVQFRLRNADVEQNNVKGDKRVFVPIEETKWNAVQMESGEAEETVLVPFEYRPLTGEETKKFGSRNQQDAIVTAAVADIPTRLTGHPKAQSALTQQYPNDGDGSTDRLERHLRQYVRRNNADFFIHKDLSGFLNRELDFYLKNEVLNLETVANAGQDLAEGWFQQLRLTRAIGGQIIDFLAQIENFQKMLWEKRKFITEAHYCITLGNVDPAFYPEILANDSQWAEWKDLFGVKDYDRTVEHLRQQPTLVFDTRYFQVDFTDRLLASFDDLSTKTDGLLIHGDGWQSVRVMEAAYCETVKCVYIDPPYNTDASAIVYKNDYKDSSWLALMENRLALSRRLMQRDGVLCCAIDDEEMSRIRLAMQNLFPKELGVVPVRSNPAGRKSKGQFSPNHEYALFVGNAEAVPGSLNKTPKEIARYPLTDDRGRFAWNNLIRRGSGDLRQDRPKMFYPVYVSDDDCIRVPDLVWDEDRQEYVVLGEPNTRETVVYPIRTQNGVQIEKRWHRGWESVRNAPTEYRARRNGDANGNAIDIDFKIRMDMTSMPKTWWDDSRYASANLGSKALRDLFGQSNFDFAKAIALVEDSLRASKCEPRTNVLDYFAGSGTTGHAVINLNREDGGERKFILVEMGTYFDTVLLARIKKVTFTPEWKEGRPQRDATLEEAERSPRIIKYIRLESYEDALDSIMFEPAEGELPFYQDDDYLLKYMLKWETKLKPR